MDVNCERYMVSLDLLQCWCLGLRRRLLLATTPTKHEQMAVMRLCGAPHNRIYVSGEIMWRRRRDESQGRPFADSSAT